MSGLVAVAMSGGLDFLAASALARVELAAGLLMSL